jgi:hypothetical protein
VTAAACPATSPSRGSLPVTSLAAAAEASPEWAASSHEPMLIGEVGLATRSMFTKRSGLPSSAVRNAAPPAALAAASSRPARRSAGRPVAAASAPSTAHAPDSSPRNR